MGKIGKRLVLQAVCFLLAAFFASGVSEENAAHSRAAYFACAENAPGIVLVEYEGGAKARVSAHENVNGIWTEIGSCEGYVGKNGMGKTREGDKKTPTGEFGLSFPFGILKDPGAKLSYTQVNQNHYWCATSESEYYNRFVDAKETGRKPAKGDEVLVRYQGVYDYCMFVEYNKDGTPGLGSCIFLHCMGSAKSTSGCIAVPKSFMKNVVKWAGEGTMIVLTEKCIPEDALARAVSLAEGETPCPLPLTGKIRIDHSAGIWLSYEAPGGEEWVSLACAENAEN